MILTVSSSYGMSVQLVALPALIWARIRLTECRLIQVAQFLAVASNDGSVRMYEIASGKQSQLTGHEEAVQTVLFDKTGEFLLSAGSDGTLRIWS